MAIETLVPFLDAYREARLRANNRAWEKGDHDLLDKYCKNHSQWFEFKDAVGKKYQNCTLDGYEATSEAQKTVVDKIHDYALHANERIEAGVGVILTGPKGTGKDHLAVALGRELWRLHGISGAFVSGPDLQKIFRQIACDHEYDHTWKIDKLVAADYLLISDPIPPSGTMTDFQLCEFLALVDSRYRQGLATWVTMNAASVADAEAKLGPACLDRLTENALISFCNWESYRKRGDW